MLACLLPPWKLLLFELAAEGVFIAFGWVAADGFMLDGLVAAGEFGIVLVEPDMGCDVLGDIGWALGVVVVVWACAMPAMPRPAASATAAVSVRFI